MSELIKALSGKKTYIIGAALALAGFAYLMKWITLEDLLGLQAALNGAGYSALRAGIEKGTGK